MSDKAIEAAAEEIRTEAAVDYAGNITNATALATAAIRAYNAAMEAEGFVHIRSDDLAAVWEYIEWGAGAQSSLCDVVNRLSMIAASPRAEGE